MLVYLKTLLQCTEVIGTRLFENHKALFKTWSLHIIYVIKLPGP